MSIPAQERRHLQAPSSRALERDLNDSQLVTLREVERFGWELKYLRRPPFQPSIPIVFDGERRSYAVIEPDGSLNEHPTIAIRH